MTLNDIGRMMKLARVPRSKTVESTYPNPCIIVHVPATHLLIVQEVVARVALKGQNITVCLLQSEEVIPGEHVYVKVKDFAADIARRNYQNETRWTYHQRRKLTNMRVVIECASVTLQ